ncbi:MAG: methionyl-tRNA formyltransferase [Pirellulales bacterium]|nr:methionyl-tRNA formyltransferase [Pirellulales bacterium]
MRLLMLGTGPFAVPTFRDLFSTRHEILALVTAPVCAARGRPAPPVSPLRDVAHEHGTPVYDPEDVNAEESQTQLRQYGADLLVVCDYGQILATETLAAARLGGINLHASLLPRYRGAAPINWALYHGETETGVTVIHMTPQVDAGPCIAQATTQIDPEEDAVQLEQRLSELGAWLMRRTIDNLEAGRLEALPQNPALASKAPRLKKSDGLVDWTRSARDIKNQVRAMEPWPKTYTFWHRKKGPPLRLILGPLTTFDAAEGDSPIFSAQKLGQSPPGTVLEAEGDRLLVVAGSGAVLPKTIQPAGKRALTVDAFLRGYRVQAGDRFGGETP